MEEYQSRAQIVQHPKVSNNTFPKYRKIRTSVAYFIFGICNNFGYVVMLTAAADIIEAQTHDTGNAVSILCHISFFCGGKRFVFLG